MPQRVYLLVTSPDAKGGIARATTTLANHLAETHIVEMISLMHRPKRSRLALDPRVTVRDLRDEATPAEKLLENQPSETPGGDRTRAYSALVDAVLPRVLGALEPGIVISTRAILHRDIARHAPAHCITIGQDHTNLQMRESKSNAQRGANKQDTEELDADELDDELDDDELDDDELDDDELDDDGEDLGERGTDVATDLDLIGEAIGQLDQYVVLTEADAESYRQMFPEAAGRLRVIRNPAPWPVLTSSVERKEIVVAAGKLGTRKGFDRLIRAYQPIAKKRPGWQLHIYGEGPARKSLTKMIAKKGLEDFVFLKGHTNDMEKVLEEASVLALTSRYEGLPMVLIEAMTKGVPIVSVDCPNGPAEIVVDGVTGRLIPNQNRKAFTRALLRLMDKPALRARMGEQALKYAGQYEVDRITQDWLDLFDALEAGRARTA